MLKGIAPLLENIFVTLLVRVGFLTHHIELFAKPIPPKPGICEQSINRRNKFI